MTDYSEAYDSLTDQINNLFSDDSGWKSIPGGLSKVSSSSLGFSWGISSGSVYYCRLPCSGQWDNVIIPESAIDLATDDSYVYVLGNSSLMIKSANNLEEWIVIKVPAGALTVLSTSSYIWIQDSLGKKWKLAKPGTTGNWIAVEDSSNTVITSSSGNSLYGISSSGEALKTDELMQSGWSLIPDFAGAKISKVFGDIDRTALYGLDSANTLKRCVSGDCTTIETAGLTPQNLTVDPKSKTLWMTTMTPGDKGNIFSKEDMPSIPDTKDLDSQRDSVIEKVKEDHKQSTLDLTLKKVAEFLKSFIKKEPETKLEDKIIVNQAWIDQMNKILPAMLRILMYIGGATLVYLFGSFLGQTVHFLAFGILAYGVYDVYFLYQKQ
jgi:hypothetical protein